ncbi:MAG: hypothetical protein Q8R91_07005 [Candidatus Omnitrophota bacterium]|nr:hypothetical protein [Candidatus Omnitrophota bacterium]
MSQAQDTPEEKLLQIIDNPSLAKPRLSTLLRRKAATFAAVPPWVSQWTKAGAGGRPILTARAANALLAGLCVLLTMVWVVDFVSLRSQFRARLQMVERAQLAAPRQAEESSTPRPQLQELLEETKRRNLFTFLPPPAEAASPSVGEQLASRVQELKLVGIIWSDNPQAIIEDTKEGKTHLLSAGESLGPIGPTVKKILKEKVILGEADGPKEWELR